MRQSILVVLLLLLLSACEPEPTPFPVAVPVTPSPTSPPTAIPVIRYALLPNTEDNIPPEDRQLLEAAAEVRILDEPLNGQSYDIAAGFGDLPNGVRAPQTLNTLLVISPEAPPLNMQYADLIRRGVNPSALTAALEISGAAALGAESETPPDALRNELANTGRPDGFGLVLGYTYTPGAAQLADQLARFNVTTRTVQIAPEAVPAALAAGEIHLALVTWTTPEEQQAWQAIYGAEFTVDLFALPISYIAAPEVTVSAFTPVGWPLPSWGG